MAAIEEAVSRDKTYQLVKVEKIDPPVGIDGGNWYRYIIALEDKEIVGTRRGTLKQVTEYATVCAQNMSARVARGSWAGTKRK